MVFKYIDIDSFAFHRLIKIVMVVLVDFVVFDEQTCEIRSLTGENLDQVVDSLVIK